jgi:hypothetical protein
MEAYLRGTPEELRRFFAGDTTALKGVQVGPVAKAVDDQGNSEALVQELARGFSRVTRPARDALRFIAEHAPTVGFDAVARNLGVDTRKLSGSMSSYGRSAPAIGALFARDYNRREYVIEPAAASVVLKAMAVYETKLDEGRED